MDIANALVTLYNSEAFMQTAFATIVFSALAGHFAHRFMGGASFGAGMNSCIVLFSICAASWVDNYRIASLVPENTLRIGTLATIMALGILIMVASLKNWLRDYV